MCQTSIVSFVFNKVGFEMKISSDGDAIGKVPEFCQQVDWDLRGHGALPPAQPGEIGGTGRGVGMKHSNELDKLLKVACELVEGLILVETGAVVCVGFDEGLVSAVETDAEGNSVLIQLGILGEPLQTFVDRFKSHKAQEVTA